MILEIIVSPQQMLHDGDDKVIYQSIKYFEAEQQNFLVRVFVNIIKQPNLVITVYRTSKIEKYWKYED